MTTQMQQARDVFSDAGINASGDAVKPEAEPVVNAEPEVEPIVEPEAGPEVEPEIEPEIDDDPEPAAAEGEAAESYTVDSLAEAIGFETSDLYSMLNVPMSDGSDPIPLGEIKDKFTEIGRENSTLKTQLTEMQGQLESAKSTTGAVGINNEMAQANAYIQQLQSSLYSEEMKENKEIDPTKYLADRMDIEDQIRSAQTYMNQLNQKQQIDNQAVLAGYNVKYTELIPAWVDESVKKADQQVMSDYMLSKGFGIGEINQMADPRIQVVVKELIDLRAEKLAATEAVKKVKKAPLMISNGRTKPKATPADKTTGLVTKAKRTKGKNDVLAAAKAVWNGQ